MNKKTLRAVGKRRIDVDQAGVSLDSGFIRLWRMNPE
jgi:hypothetical protein